MESTGCRAGRRCAHRCTARLRMAFNQSVENNCSKSGGLHFARPRPPSRPRLAPAELHLQRRAKQRPLRSHRPGTSQPRPLHPPRRLPSPPLRHNPRALTVCLDSGRDSHPRRHPEERSDEGSLPPSLCSPLFLCVLCVKSFAFLCVLCVSAVRLPYFTTSVKKLFKVCVGPPFKDVVNYKL